MLGRQNFRLDYLGTRVLPMPGGPLTRTRRLWRTPAIALAAFACAAALAPSASARAVELPVSFEVTNTNTSRVPCPSDGRSYTVSGHLVAPDAVLGAGSRAVTLYLHGLGYGEFYWRFQAVPGYDFAAAQARAGHTSVVVDRLGYDSSGHPDGRDSCTGSEADVAHQIVGALRSGSYRIGARAGVPFTRVALAGHSMGSVISQVEAYSFRDIDALVVTAYADQGQTPLLLSESVKTGLVCATGGQPAEGGGPGGYAYFGQTPEDSRAMMYHNARPRVIAAADALRNLDPCGLIGSMPQTQVTNQVELGTVTVPVLIVCGSEDALFGADGCSRQQERYSGSPDVSTVVIGGTGHALALERTRKRFQAAVSTWLKARGF
jgi:pimeloyl-ACP methyl ester carboxylesterase